MPLTFKRPTSEQYWDQVFKDADPFEDELLEEQPITPVEEPAAELTPAEGPQTLPLEDEQSGNFVRGVQAGIEQTKGLGGGLKAAVGSLIGNDAMVESGMDYYRDKMAAAEEFAGDTMTVEEIQSASDAGAYIAYTLGTVVPDIVGALATGGAGGLLVKQGLKYGLDKGAKELMESGLEKEAAEYLFRRQQQAALGGAAVYEGSIMTGSSFAQTLEETGVEAPMTALAVGITNGALNMLPFMKTFEAIFPNKSASEFADGIAGQLVDAPSWKIEALKDIGQTMGWSGMVEGLQYIVEQEAITFVNNNYTNEERIAYMNYLENAEKQSGLLNNVSAGLLFGKVVGTGTAAYKGATGQYGQETDISGARDVTPDPDFAAGEITVTKSIEQRVRDKIDQYRDDPFTGMEETGDALLDESLQRMQDFQPEAATDAPIEVIQAEEVIAADGTQVVPRGGGNYGAAHRFDQPLSEADTPVADQLLQLSVSAQSPEALDPENNDVVVEAIDQDDVDRIFDRNATLKMETVQGKVKSMPVIEEAYSDAVKPHNTVAGVTSDLAASGVPKAFMDAVTGIYVHDEADNPAPAMTGRATQGISINRTLIDNSSTDTDALSELAWSVTHEVYHAADFKLGLSDKNPDFSITLGGEADTPTVEAGPIMKEIYDNWVNETELGQRFNYPFNDLISDIADPKQDNEGLNATYREEVFAQLGALFHSNPKQLQEQAPLAYDYIKGIRDSNLTPAQPIEATDGNITAQADPDTSQPEGISGEIRAPPVTGSEQSVQPTATGPDGEGSAGEGRADTGVADPTEQETGERERPEVQADLVTGRTIKRNSTFNNDGRYDVTYPNGEVYWIYRDTVSNLSTPIWLLDYRSLDAFELPRDQKMLYETSGIGYNRKEALAKLDELHTRRVSDKESKRAASRTRQPVQTTPSAVEQQPPETSVTERTVKRADDFDMSGHYDVTYPDGTVYQIYYNKEINRGTPWHTEQDDLLGAVYYDPLLGLGDNKKEALSRLDELHEERVVRAEARAAADAVAEGQEVLVDDDFEEDFDYNDIPDDFNYIKAEDAQADLKRLQAIDANEYDGKKVRTLAELQESIPLNERIAGKYQPNTPLSPVAGGSFLDLDLNARGDGLDITQQELNDILTEAIRLTDTGGATVAQATVDRLGINANTIVFWDRALQLSDNARYWYEVSAEAMRKVMPDLTDAEIKQFISVVAATSPVANPYVNMHRAVATFANFLQGRPVDNDLVITKAVTDALKTSDLEGLKTGSFGGTMQLVLGMSTPTLSTNDRQVAATFGTTGDEIGKNPVLYEVMSRFYIGLRDKINASLPDGEQPYETWQLQALGWVEQRYKNEFVGQKEAEGMSPAEALSAYESATPEEISGGINDVDDYSMSLVGRSATGGRNRKGAIQILEESGIEVPNNLITREILMDLRVPAALSPTTKTFRDKPIITAEINSLRNEIGRDARAVFDAAVEGGNTQVADEYHAVFATLLQKASKKGDNPFISYFKALGLSSLQSKPTRIAVPTGSTPFTTGGTYMGDVSPNIRVPVPPQVSLDQLNIVMTSLAKQWDQDAVPASHMTEITDDGVRENYIETSQVFVKTLEVLSREQIEAFAAALPDGADMNYTRYPNGYEFNVLAFDTDTFEPVTPDMQLVADAADQMLIVDDTSITKISTQDAQWTSAGYSMIEDYDQVIDSFNENVYNSQVEKLIGKVQRESNGKVRDLTEKQILAALRRKSPTPNLAGQSSARIQKARGIIQQQLGDFANAETIAKGLATDRDTRLKLFVQKNARKVLIRPEQKRNPVLQQAVRDRVDRKISATRLNQIFEEEGRFVRPFIRETVPKVRPDKDYLNALKKTDREEAKGKPRKDTYFQVPIEDGKRVGVRLDIPSYTWLIANERIDIVTVHEARPRGKDGAFRGQAGARVGYYPTIRVKNVDFAVPEKGALNISQGKDKTTIATMEGDYVAATDDQNYFEAVSNIGEEGWVQASMNPERHSFFYDLEQQRPIVKADEVIQIGNFVLVQNPEFDDVEKFAFIKTRNQHMNILDDGSESSNTFTFNDEIDVQRTLAQRVKDMPAYAAVIDRYKVLEDFERQAAEYMEMGRLPARMSPRDQENLMHGRVKDDLEQFERDYVVPLAETLQSANLTVNQLGWYALAKHAPERNKHIFDQELAIRAKKLAKIQRTIDALEAKDDDVDHSRQIDNLREKYRLQEALPYQYADTGSGLTNAEAAQIVQTFEESNSADKIKAAHQKLMEITQFRRDVLKNAQLLDADTKQDWEEKYEFYVPLKGFAAEKEVIDKGEEIIAGNGTRGFSVRGSESMKAMGRITLPVNPALKAIEDVQQSIVRARKNAVMITLFDLLGQLGQSKSFARYSPHSKNRPKKKGDVEPQELRDMMNEMRPNGDGTRNYLQLKKDGQTRLIYFRSDTLNRTLQNASANELSFSYEAMEKYATFVRSFQNFRRNMYINYNPTWGLVNPIRDVQTGIVYALAEADKEGSRTQSQNIAGATFKSYFPAMKAYYRLARGKEANAKTAKDKEYLQYAREFVEDGAPTGLTLTKTSDEILADIQGHFNNGRIKAAFRSIAKWVEDFNQTMENAVRLSAYIEARKVGAEREDAATLAKDLTVNFNRKGENSAIIDMHWLFFNAALQGNVNFVDAMAAGRKGEDGKKARFTWARATAAGMVSVGFGIAMYNILQSEEDDDQEKLYNDFEEHHLNRTLTIVYGDKNEAFAAPMPYGYNFFTNIGRLSAEVTLGTKTIEEAGIDLWDNFLLNFIPRHYSAGDNLAEQVRGFAPDYAIPFWEVGVNKNFFGSPIYVEQNPFLKSKLADAYVAKRSTNEWLKGIAQFMNDATGGSKYQSGLIDISPDVMDYTIAYFLGGVGTFFGDISDVVGKMLADEEIRKSDMPILSKFFKSPSEYKDQFEYYDNNVQVYNVQAELKEKAAKVTDARAQWNADRKVKKLDPSLYADRVAPHEANLQAAQKKFESYGYLLQRLDMRKKSNKRFRDSFNPMTAERITLQLTESYLKKLRDIRKVAEANTDPVARAARLDEIRKVEQRVYDLFNREYRAAKAGEQ